MDTSAVAERMSLMTCPASCQLSPSSFTKRSNGMTMEYELLNKTERQGWLLCSPKMTCKSRI